jgi:1,4-dihydroxy-2-naphthoate octaprenyltransferase
VNAPRAAELASELRGRGPETKTDRVAKKKRTKNGGASGGPGGGDRSEASAGSGSPILRPGLPAPGSARAWLLAARPRTLPVAFAPVFVGAAIAYSMGAVRWVPLSVALAAALLIQIGTNFANDVFDFQRGADEGDRLGPVRAAQAGLLTPAALKRGMIVAFALATAAGAYLAWVVGPIIVAIGVVSILAGIAYTGGPFPLAYNGLGDVFVFLFFGIVAVVGSTFVGSGKAPPVAFLAAIPVGALATAVLVVNNIRDVASDERANKRTLVVRFGRRFGVVLYFALVILAFATPGVLAGLHLASPWVLLSLAALPRALRIATKVAFKTDGTTLTECLGETAQLLLAHSLFMGLGFAMLKVR